MQPRVSESGIQFGLPRGNEHSSAFRTGSKGLECVTDELNSTDTRSHCRPGARELISNQTLGKAQVALEKQVGKEPFRGDGQEQKTMLCAHTVTEHPS